MNIIIFGFKVLDIVVNAELKSDGKQAAVDVGITWTAMDPPEPAFIQRGRTYLNSTPFVKKPGSLDNLGHSL